jgi:hypothetical protein
MTSNFGGLTPQQQQYILMQQQLAQQQQYQQMGTGMTGFNSMNSNQQFQTNNQGEFNRW